jgi:hypothetical protein
MRNPSSVSFGGVWYPFSPLSERIGPLCYCMVEMFVFSAWNLNKLMQNCTKSDVKVNHNHQPHGITLRAGPIDVQMACPIHV